MISSPRANALRGALLGLGAEQRDASTLHLGDLDLIIGVTNLAIPDTSPAPQLAERVATLARTFRIPVSINGAPATDIAPPTTAPGPHATRRAPRTPRIAKRTRVSMVDDLLENVVGFDRATPLAARFSDHALRAVVTERDNILTITFDTLPAETQRSSLGLALVRLGTRLDARSKWLCVIFPEVPPTWLDRTMRNVDCIPEGNDRAYLRRPRSN